MKTRRSRYHGHRFPAEQLRRVEWVVPQIMSAAARKKISDAMKRRFAESHKAANVSGPQVPKAGSVGAKQATVKRRTNRNRLTAAGRKRLSELARKRWISSRKLGKTTL